MEYNIGLGAWNSVFAVPSELVDKHLKLAGAAQLKVILWVLRNAGNGFTVGDVAAALRMQEADVRDCMQYWVQTGLLMINENTISPAPAVPDITVPDDAFEEPSAPVPVEEVPSAPSETAVQPPAEKKRPLSRPEKPDLKYLSERIAQDDSIACMMQSADEIFGRITSNSDKATLLLIHEYDGLPVEVIIMLLQYAFSIGKCNMRYIEKMAVTWAEEEITTLEAAENKIKSLTGGRKAAKLVQRIIGADEHSPTEKETEYAALWLDVWKFSPDMIRAAYEVCVDTKGKYIPKYTSSILERWYNSGITTTEQVRQEKQSRRRTKKTEGYEATYDIEEYESTSVTDGEW